jgi:hypothetical protein
MSHRHVLPEKNNHHILPRSRRPDLALAETNIVEVFVKEHDLYHQLFYNMTPDEILDYLVNTFWGGQMRFVEDYLYELD